MKKKNLRGEIKREREARETYRVESRRYKEKLRGKRERESKTTRPILPPPTLPCETYPVAG